MIMPISLCLADLAEQRSSYCTHLLGTLISLAHPLTLLFFPYTFRGFDRCWWFESVQLLILKHTNTLFYFLTGGLISNEQPLRILKPAVLNHFGKKSMFVCGLRVTFSFPFSLL